MLIQQSAVSPTIRVINGVVSTSIFAVISPENTTISDKISIVIQMVILCLAPESVVFSASAR